MPICKSLGATQYLSGPFGKDYLPLEKFKEHSIDIKFHSYNPDKNMIANDGENLSSLHYLFHYAELNYGE